MGSEYGLDSGLPDLTYIFVIIGIGAIMILGLVLWGEYQESQTIYKMPNGVICELKLMKGGGAFSIGSTFEFKQCRDGKKYINPEYYKEIKK